eukprot:1547702-Pleurochrysis_carterae.AAC.1
MYTSCLLYRELENIAPAVPSTRNDSSIYYSIISIGYVALADELRRAWRGLYVRGCCSRRRRQRGRLRGDSAALR